MTNTDVVVRKLSDIFAITAIVSLIGSLLVLDGLVLYAIGWCIVHCS